jgi:gluconate 2-dehydrogenase gamma chain
MSTEHNELAQELGRSSSVPSTPEGIQPGAHPQAGSSGPLATPVSRGHLLRLTGTGIRAGLLAYAGGRVLSHAEPVAAAPATAAISPPQPETGTAADMHHLPLRFFNDAQAAVITAMAERIFPADSTGPGATDAHVTDYIDGQLAGGWGMGDRTYMQGPFYTPETSGHGWQYPSTPRDTYSDSLAALAAYCQQKYKNTYDALDTTNQDAILTDMAAGKIPMPVPSDQFFTMFFQNVKEGLFADPMYGGNYNFIGWKWVRYPGNPMAYGDPYGNYIDQFTYPYNVAPKGLADQMF